VRLNNLQVLRVLAAAGVVLYHLGLHAKHHLGVNVGFTATSWVAGFPVPLFFVVSGFVLTYALRTARPGRFLLARFLRLYPGYWLALLGVVVLMRLRVYTEYDRWLIHFVNVTEVLLLPAGPGRCPYLLGYVEWSLVYEVFLSVALTGLAAVGGRRVGVPVLAAGWLAVIIGKMVLRPGYAFDGLPHWSTIALSAYNTPFLLGVLVYQVKDRGGWVRWPLLPVVGWALVVLPAKPLSPEWHWVALGGIAAGVLWLAVRFRQLADRNPVVRLGDCTYGLFLFHVPLILAVYHAAARAGWVGRVEVVVAAGVVAMVGGLLFGRVESRLHARLKPLANLTVGDVRVRWGKLRLRLGRRIPG
jgi:peptidoglycan/LPS O-acetylase OafA/YrhL